MFSEGRRERVREVLVARGAAAYSGADWSQFGYAGLSTPHQFDLTVGAWIYRAFLLPDLLEIDLGFAPAAEFAASSGASQLLFGTAELIRAVAVVLAPALLMGVADL